MVDQTNLEKLGADKVLHHSDGTPRGFATGEHITLRPVLKEDLPALAGLLAEDPLPRTPGPWTLARLEKAFADKKEPGLWKHRSRYYVALDSAARIWGYAYECTTDAPAVFRTQHWLAEAHPQRWAAGCELVALHLGLLRDWQAARNVSTRILAGEEEQAQWLLAAGFTPEVLLPGQVWHNGGLCDLQHYVWLSDEVKAQPAFSTGEPASSVEVEAIRDWA